MINGYTQDGRGGSIVDTVYQVSAVDGGGSLTILRQPIFDQVFSGNGARQYTNYLPVVNRTGHDQYFHGALIYVATDKGVQPAKQDEALDDNCIYILSVTGAIPEKLLSHGVRDLEERDPANHSGAPGARRSHRCPDGLRRTE